MIPNYIEIDIKVVIGLKIGNEESIDIRLALSLALALAIALALALKLLTMAIRMIFVLTVALKMTLKLKSLCRYPSTLSANPERLIFFLLFFKLICGSFFLSGSCSYSSAAKAFIFSLYNTNSYDPVKLAQYRYLNKAMYSCSSYGPTFGGNLGQHDIYIPNLAANNQNSFTICGSTYSLPQGYSAGYCSFFAGGNYFTPTDIEVFYEATS